MRIPSSLKGNHMTDVNMQKVQSMMDQLEKVHNDKVEQFKKEYPDIDPYLITDTNGRPILLDSLTAMVNANVMMAQMDFYQQPIVGNRGRINASGR